MTINRWEYRHFGVHFIAEPGGPDGMPADTTEWLMQLNGLGEEGWEVVGPVTIHNASPTTSPSTVVLLLLKRQKV